MIWEHFIYSLFIHLFIFRASMTSETGLTFFMNNVNGLLKLLYQRPIKAQSLIWPYSVNCLSAICSISERISRKPNKSYFGLLWKRHFSSLEISKVTVIIYATWSEMSNMHVPTSKGPFAQFWEWQDDRWTNRRTCYLVLNYIMLQDSFFSRKSV